ncbi:MAG: Mur ligase family protein [Sphaerochaeta sp.]|nr:Mur ligase family protein [Sphaerochaeta sp.]
MDFSGRIYYMVGIKGTGMASLAVLLKRAGGDVSGCDTAEVFSTDSMLQRYAIEIDSGFSPSLLKLPLDFVIYSSAYAINIPILSKAKELGLSVYSYPQFLAFLSQQSDSYAVSGTHGKTTTTSVASYLLSSGSLSEFPLYSIYGSFLQGAEALMFQGSDCALFEACEYQDHFLSYSLRGALVTNIEHDHPDYFSSRAAVQKSFEQFVDNLQPKGFLICCSDDPGARKLAQYCRERRTDVTLLTYGFDDNGPFRIIKNGYFDTYTLACLDGKNFKVNVHDRSLVGDHIGAVVLALAIILDRPQPKLYLDEHTLITEEVVPTLAGMLVDKLVSFPGCVGRSELMLEQDSVIYIDDYAHHPTEISATLQELRARYPSCIITLLFAPHTSSRTKAFLKDFVSALSQADRVIIQASFASARNDVSEGEDMGKVLETELSKHIMRTFRCRCQACSYAPDDQSAVAIAASWLQPNSLCITMGAGNNRALSACIAQARRSL